MYKKKIKTTNYYELHLIEEGKDIDNLDVATYDLFYNVTLKLGTIIVRDGHLQCFNPEPKLSFFMPMLNEIIGLSFESFTNN